MHPCTNIYCFIHTYFLHATKYLTSYVPTQNFISALNSCCIAALKLLCTSCYFKPVFVCIQYDLFTCCFMTYLKALILNISFFIPLQIHLMSLYSSIPFFVIQILFMTCFYAVAFHIIYSKKFKAFNNA